MIRHAILSVIAHAMVLWGLTKFIPNYIEISGGVLAFVFPGMLFGILNSLLKPLIKLLSLPLIVLTGGLFSSLINIFILFLLEFSIKLVSIGEIVFDVKGGVIGYFFTSIVLAVMNEIAHWIIKK